MEQGVVLFSFPGVNEKAVVGVELNRTMRITEEYHATFSQPTFGVFPMRLLGDEVDSFSHGDGPGQSVIFPMYQSEAMWLNFHYQGYPCAIEIAVCGINVVTGANHLGLSSNPQNYMVVPDQPWLDAYCDEKGVWRQFVAPILPPHFKEQTQPGSNERGFELRVVVYPMKAAAYDQFFCEEVPFDTDVVFDLPPDILRGGCKEKLKIRRDPYDFSVWDMEKSKKCVFHILNSQRWRSTTGELPTHKPLMARDYDVAGLPWLDAYSEQAPQPPIPSPIPPGPDPAILPDSSVALFAGRKGVYAVSTLSGEEQWFMETPDTVVSDLVMVDGIILCGCSDRKLYGFDVRTKRQKWATETNNKYWYPFAVMEAIVCLATDDGKACAALDLHSGSLMWKHKTVGRIQCKPTIGDGRVYFGATDGKVYALDLKTGAESWVFDKRDWRGTSVYFPPADPDIFRTR